MIDHVPYIGVTGGIGSGKTTFSQLLELSNIPVYNADKEAKRLMETSDSLRQKLDTLTVHSFYIDGVLDRPKFAEWLFSDASHLDLVNQIVHPAVAHDFLNWATIVVSNRPEIKAVAIEAAILLEANFDQFLDYVLLVDAPLEERIARTMIRDHATAQQVKARIEAQMSDKERRKRASFIVNNGENDALIPQLECFLNSLQL